MGTAVSKGDADEWYLSDRISSARWCLKLISESTSDFLIRIKSKTYFVAIFPAQKCVGMTICHREIRKYQRQKVSPGDMWISETFLFNLLALYNTMIFYGKYIFFVPLQLNMIYKLVILNIWVQENVHGKNWHAVIQLLCMMLVCIPIEQVVLLLKQENLVKYLKFLSFHCCFLVKKRRRKRDQLSAYLQWWVLNLFIIEICLQSSPNSD